MVRSVLVVIALIAALGLVVPVLAQNETTEVPLTSSPSLLGPTGAWLTPTTDLAPRTYTIGYHWLNDTYKHLPKLNVSPVEQLEVGATWIDPHNASVDEQLIFNAKYLFTEEDDDSPAVAVGVIDITDEYDQAFYGVISKTFGDDVPIIVNLGAASGDMIDGLFGSVTLRLQPKIDFITEYDSSQVNFGLRLRPYEGVSIDALSVDNGSDREFGFGAAYTAAF